METNETPGKPERVNPDTLKALRKSHGLTQEDLATALCLSCNTVKAMESGRRPVTPRTEKAIMEHFSKLDAVKGWKLVPCAEYSFEPAASGDAT